jgi:hypothetical protein
VRLEPRPRPDVRAAARHAAARAGGEVLGAGLDRLWGSRSSVLCGRVAQRALGTVRPTRRWSAPGRSRTCDPRLRRPCRRKRRNTLAGTSSLQTPHIRAGLHPRYSELLIDPRRATAQCQPRSSPHGDGTAPATGSACTTRSSPIQRPTHVRLHPRRRRQCSRGPCSGRSFPRSSEPLQADDSFHAQIRPRAEVVLVRCEALLRRLIRRGSRKA